MQLFRINNLPGMAPNKPFALKILGLKYGPEGEDDVIRQMKSASPSGLPLAPHSDALATLRSRPSYSLVPLLPCSLLHPPIPGGVLAPETRNLTPETGFCSTSQESAVKLYTTT